MAPDAIHTVVQIQVRWVDSEMLEHRMPELWLFLFVRHENDDDLHRRVKEITIVES